MTKSLATQKYVEIGARLREFAEENYPSLSAFGRAIGMKPQAVQVYLRGVSRPGNEIQARLRAIGADVEYILTGIRKKPVLLFQTLKESGASYSPLPGLVYYPVVSLIKAGRGQIVEAEATSKEFVLGPADPKLRGARFFEVYGDSMMDKWEPGDLVMAHPLIRPKDGDYAVIGYDEKYATFKRIFYRNGLIVLKAENSSVPDDTIDPNKEEIWFFGAVISTVHKSMKGYLTITK